MQLVGQVVKHKAFGQGIITNCSGNMVTVSFSQGDKKFLYPDAFANFLTLKDTSAQNELNDLWGKRIQAEAVQRQVFQEKQERRHKIRNLKITPNSQAAFNLDLKDLDRVFSSGIVSTGCYLSGYSKGEPRVPNRLRPNSACLLTVCPPNGLEKERRILGAFMVKDDFLGELCRNGMIECHARYKVRLDSESSLLYWNYFEHGDPVPRWGSMAFKYFSNSIMQRILFDLKKVLKGAEKESVIQGFYQYFCEVNRLPQIKGND
ncbi:MAG: hypothetical protein PHT34_01075 [Oscillospiraceae bacterium]|nr:hypothetical protein [Oscillospiraceae bacterium]